MNPYESIRGFAQPPLKLEPLEPQASHELNELMAG